MPYTCAKNCGRALRAPTICSNCESAFHRACETFYNYQDSSQNSLRLCSICNNNQEVTSNLTICKSSNKRRRLEQLNPTESATDAAAPTSVASDSENDEVTLTTVLRAVERGNETTVSLQGDLRAFKNEVTTRLASLEDNQIKDREHQNAINTNHENRIQSIESNSNKSIMITGLFSKSTNNPDILALVLRMFSFFDIPIHHSDIKATRLIKKGEKSN